MILQKLPAHHYCIGIAGGGLVVCGGGGELVVYGGGGGVGELVIDGGGGGGGCDAFADVQFRRLVGLLELMVDVEIAT